MEFVGAACEVPPRPGRAHDVRLPRFTNHPADIRRCRKSKQPVASPNQQIATWSSDRHAVECMQCLLPIARLSCSYRRDKRCLVGVKAPPRDGGDLFQSLGIRPWGNPAGRRPRHTVRERTPASLAERAIARDSLSGPLAGGTRDRSSGSMVNQPSTSLRNASRPSSRAIIAGQMTPSPHPVDLCWDPAVIPANNGMATPESRRLPYTETHAPAQTDNDANVESICPV